MRAWWLLALLRVAVCQCPGAQVTTLAGSGKLGFADGSGANASFARPYGGAIGADALFFVDANGVRRVTAGGAVTTLPVNFTVFDLGLEISEMTAIISGGEANPTLSRLTIATGAVTRVAGGITGFADGLGAVARFTSPQHVECDTLGNTFIADSTINVIRVLTADGFVATLAGGGCAGCTSAGFANGQGTAATFSRIGGMAVGGGVLYVATNSEVRAVVIATTAVSTLAGAPIDYGATTIEYFIDGVGSNARFSFWNGAALKNVAIDAVGDILVADVNNNVVRRVTRSGVVTTIVGGYNIITPNNFGPGPPSRYGYAGFNDGQGTCASFKYPSAVMVNKTSGVIFVLDMYNNAVRTITMDYSPSATPAATPTPSPTRASAMTSTVCGVALQNYAASAACPPGQVVASVSSASYGLPSITSRPGCIFTATSCNAAASQSVFFFSLVFSRRRFLTSSIAIPFFSNLAIFI